MTRGSGAPALGQHPRPPRRRAHGRLRSTTPRTGEGGRCGARAELARDAGHRAEAAGLARVEEQPLVRPLVGEQERAAVGRPRDRAEAPRAAEEHALAEAAAGGRAGARARCARSPAPAHERDRARPRSPARVLELRAGRQRVRGDPRTGAIEQQQAAARGDEQPAAVRRPGELAHARHRGAPPQRAAPRRPRRRRCARAGRRSASTWPASGRQAGATRAVGGAVAAVARPVAVDHAQGRCRRGTRCGSRPRAPSGPTVTGTRRAGERPPHAPPRVERRELVIAPGHDEAAVRRPRRAVVGPEPPLGCRRARPPTRCRRHRRAAAAARQPREHRPGARLPGAEDVAHPPPDVAARRAGRRRARGCHHGERHRGHQGGPAPAPASRHVAGVRGAHHPPRPLARGGVVAARRGVAPRPVRAARRSFTAGHRP